MKNPSDSIAVGKFCSVEPAERFLIAGTDQQPDPSTGDMQGENFAEALYRPVLALGLTITFIWFLQIEAVSDFLAATV